MGKRERPFEFKGRKLVVRAVWDGPKWMARVFEGDRPVTATIYTVSWDTALDAKTSLNMDCVQEIMETAQRSVECEWDKLLI